MTDIHRTKPSIDRLRQVLDYDPKTGQFIWNVALSNRVCAGGDAGTICNGYLYITVDGYRTGAQRIAVAMVSGDWPIGEVDHLNGSKLDNRIGNLRASTGRVNRQNVRIPRRHNTLGLLGVRRLPNGKYRAALSVSGKTIYSKVTGTPESAMEQYIALKRAHHEGNTL